MNHPKSDLLAQVGSLPKELKNEVQKHLLKCPTCRELAQKYEISEFKINDIVQCMGEADELFIVVDLRDTGAFLENLAGLGHGWESFSKLTKIERKRAVKKLDKMIEELHGKLQNCLKVRRRLES